MGRTYVPRIRRHDGLLVPTMEKRVVYTRETHEGIRRIERQWFMAEARGGHYASSCLRRMPHTLWNELMDLLPRCECGRAVAPIRARYVKHEGARAFCSERCHRRAARQRERRKYYHWKKERRAEAEALAEAMYQV